MKRLVWRELQAVGDDFALRAGYRYGALVSFAKSYSKDEIRALLAKAGTSDLVLQEEGEKGPCCSFGAMPHDADPDRRTIYIEGVAGSSRTIPRSLPWPFHKFDILRLWEQRSEDAPDPPKLEEPVSFVRAAVVTLTLGAIVAGLLYAQSRGKVTLRDPPMW